MIASYAFYNCSKLTTLSFPQCFVITSYAFTGCPGLISFYLYGNFIAQLGNSNAFMYTPITNSQMANGVYGSIYVKQSLLTSWKTATNWTYYSSRFVGDG